tara:strand:+ start:6413 stop:6568 length:156 start_codon:yes stop_codon:yes gene_type:complete
MSKEAEEFYNAHPITKHWELDGDMITLSKAHLYIFMQQYADEQIKLSSPVV